MVAVIFAVSFLALVCALAARGTVPPPVAAVYLIASLAAAVAYGVDKRSAQSGAWRTPERTLHVLALLGGSPGALAAQRMFHHKSQKSTFRVVFWSTVV
jgi:uncharacterized membrane protein YsdA (DUF1294 family)